MTGLVTVRNHAETAVVVAVMIVVVEISEILTEEMVPPSKFQNGMRPSWFLLTKISTSLNKVLSIGMKCHYNFWKDF